jgi:hypothetical protein
MHLLYTGLQDTYSVHKADLVLCRARFLNFPAFWTSIPLCCLMSTARFPSPLAGRVLAFPHIQYGPVSPRVHALLHHTVRYNVYIYLQTDICRWEPANFSLVSFRWSAI